MNKVSWTSRVDLYRGTSVVLTTVLLMPSSSLGRLRLVLHLLRFIGVLEFSGGGGLGFDALTPRGSSLFSRNPNPGCSRSMGVIPNHFFFCPPRSW